MAHVEPFGCWNLGLSPLPERPAAAPSDPIVGSLGDSEPTVRPACPWASASSPGPLPLAGGLAQTCFLQPRFIPGRRVCTSHGARAFPGPCCLVFPAPGLTPESGHPEASVSDAALAAASAARSCFKLIFAGASRSHALGGHGGVSTLTEHDLKCSSLSSPGPLPTRPVSPIVTWPLASVFHVSEETPPWTSVCPLSLSWALSSPPSSCRWRDFEDLHGRGTYHCAQRPRVLCPPAVGGRRGWPPARLPCTVLL